MVESSFKLSMTNPQLRSEVSLLRKRYFNGRKKPGILSFENNMITFLEEKTSIPYHFDMERVSSYKTYMTILEINHNNKVLAFDFAKKQTKTEALASSLVGSNEALIRREAKQKIEPWVQLFKSNNKVKHSASKRLYFWIGVIVILFAYIIFMAYQTRESSSDYGKVNTFNFAGTIAATLLPIILGFILYFIIYLNNKRKKKSNDKNH